MKILQIHKDFQVRGGASRYFFEVSRLLKDHGHEVAFFSTARKGNEPSPWSPFFIPYRSFAQVGFRPHDFFHMLYSVSAARAVSRLIDQFRPDIIHLHSIYHQISPSVIFEMKRRHIPIVMTVHDFHLIAPNHALYHDGKICEVTKKKAYYRALNHKCIKGSRMAGLADAIEHYFHDLIGAYRGVDLFICPSRFQAKKLIEYGMPENKIHILPNFAPVFKKGKRRSSNYVLFTGRLSSEKGLPTLIAAAKELPHIPFQITGDGPLRKPLQEKIKREGLHNITLTGYKCNHSLEEAVQNCRLLVLPSESFENCPLSILEAFAAAKPVIASRTGGIPELVRHGGNGLLFAPGNASGLRRHIEALWKSPARTASLGGSALADAETKFSGETHYRKLYALYADLVKRRS